MRGRSQRRYCIAHIWCWPTPVVQIMSSRPAVSACSVSSDALRLQQVALVAVAERELLAPVGELGEPGLGLGPDALAFSARRARRARRGPASAARRPGCPPCGASRSRRRRCRGGRRRAGRERRKLAGDAVVEARADRDQHVALVHRPVRPLGAVHARPAEVELVRLRERALRHQRRHDRQLPQLGELAQLRRRPRR